VFRNALPELFEVFDFADPSTVTGRRNTSTVAPQALFMMNNPFLLECARGLARRPEIAAEKEFLGKIGRLHLLCYGRPATPEEVTLAQAFISDGGDTGWQRYAQALMLANEFVFVD
jgi:hypothetical protein